MFCEKCGASNDDNAKFCGSCGAPLKAKVFSGEVIGQDSSTASKVDSTNGENNANNINAFAKSRFTAGLMAILLGFVGVHNFYLGNNKDGVIKLCITVFGFWLCGIGFLVSYIWGVIDGINILCGNVNTDANGVPLVD